MFYTQVKFIFIIVNNCIGINKTNDCRSFVTGYFSVYNLTRYDTEELLQGQIPLFSGDLISVSGSYVLHVVRERNKK